jgi:RNase_H superfamily
MRRQKTTPSTIVPTRLSSVTTSPAPMSPRSYVAAGFERAAEMGSGADAVLGYERWTDSRNPAELEAIARYNEEDCRATLALRDWLVAVRPATAARLAPVPQRALDAETVEAASAREALTPHEVVSAPATRSASIARGRSTRGAGRLAGPCRKKGSPQFGGAAVRRLTSGDSRTCPAARTMPSWGTPA